MNATPGRDAASSLIAEARSDLELVDTLLASGADRLVAVALLARATMRADAATFVLLDQGGGARTALARRSGGREAPRGPSSGRGPAPEM